jgi:hypothetical protein
VLAVEYGQFAAENVEDRKEKEEGAVQDEEKEQTVSVTHTDLVVFYLQVNESEEYGHEKDLGDQDFGKRLTLVVDVISPYEPFVLGKKAGFVFAIFVVFLILWIRAQVFVCFLDIAAELAVIVRVTDCSGFFQR